MGLSSVNVRRAVLFHSLRSGAHVQVEREAIEIGAGASVSGFLRKPASARAIYVFAHGAGAGMSHAFMEDVSVTLAQHGIATLRFNFPFMEALSEKRWRRTDAPAVAYDVVRAAVAHARGRAPDLPLFAGGKSFGARMTSQAQAEAPMQGVRGLVFIGFPLHLAKKPSVTRGQHLASVQTPMLFVQGARDALADPTLMRSVCASLPQAKLHVIEGADHGFAVLVRSGRNGAGVMREIGCAVARWIDSKLN